MRKEILSGEQILSKFSENKKMSNSARSGKVAEEYYQFNEEIFLIFPKFRPALDYYTLNEKTSNLYPISAKGERITKERYEEILAFCQQGKLFISRTDYRIYASYLAKQVDLVLLDKNLQQAELIQVIVKALNMRVVTFFDQPTAALCESLIYDVMVFSAYVWDNPLSIDKFMEELYTGPYDLNKHSVNTLIIGTWLTINADPDYNRGRLDRMAKGLIIHDIGMTRIPPHIYSKKNRLNKEEVEKLHSHVPHGANILQKMELLYDETNRCIKEHHERVDGSGYPAGLVGKDISTIGRIIAIADSLSSMIQEKGQMRLPIPIVKAVEILHSDSEKYDFRICEILLNAYRTEKLIPLV